MATPLNSERCVSGTGQASARRVVKNAVQRGRSKRRGDAYFRSYVEPLRAARTKPADFFNILLVEMKNVSERAARIIWKRGRSAIESPRGAEVDKRLLLQDKNRKRNPRSDPIFAAG